MSDISKASLPKAIFLMGPTASGKTALAIELRKILPVELISVDSALIYKGMDIGTAKPNAEELLAAPHRFYHLPTIPSYRYHHFAEILIPFESPAILPAILQHTLVSENQPFQILYRNEHPDVLISNIPLPSFTVITV